MPTHKTMVIDSDTKDEMKAIAHGTRRACLDQICIIIKRNGGKAENFLTDEFLAEWDERWNQPGLVDWIDSLSFLHEVEAGQEKDGDLKVSSVGGQTYVCDGDMGISSLPLDIYIERPLWEITGKRYYFDWEVAE